MIKCQSCREKDVELLTLWERVKNALFYKLNEVFFADDLEDLKTQKYTQGYAEGNVDGFRQSNYKREYVIPEVQYGDA
jgi:hypothetical protein